ncbi:MAG: hypothetical protein KDA61_10585, partial [Planctomycetales bacterium]|nr:hypothetical protein [Planctomycetales bacterium]
MCRSHAEVIADFDAQRPCCVVIDADGGGGDVEGLRRHLKQNALEAPLVVLTDGEDATALEKAAKPSELRVLEKPFAAEQLSRCVEESLSYCDLELRRKRHHAKLEERLVQLSPQDREVLHLMLQGQKNRTIAKRLEV